MHPDKPEMTETDSTVSESGNSHEHTLVVRITYELKNRLDQLALDLDRNNSDIVRMVLRLGIPLLESLSEAEREVVREYTDIFRRLRRIRSPRDV